MDLDNAMIDFILLWVLGIADVVMLSLLGYGLYLFRKSTYDFEKRISNQFKRK